MWRVHQACGAVLRGAGERVSHDPRAGGVHSHEHWRDAVMRAHVQCAVPQDPGVQTFEL